MGTRQSDLPAPVEALTFNPPEEEEEEAQISYPRWVGLGASLGRRHAFTHAFKHLTSILNTHS